MPPKRPKSPRRKTNPRPAPRRFAGPPTCAAAVLVAGVLLGCGDRAPPAVWPEPQPPSLARPLPPPADETATGSPAAPADAPEPTPTAGVDPPAPAPDPASAPPARQSAPRVW
jgi:hypothetical protein